jgi:ankyrin repeat protein
MSSSIEGLELSTERVKDILTRGEYKSVSELTLTQLLAFKEPITNANVFLFAVRECSLDTLRVLVNILKTLGDAEFEKFINQLGVHGSNAVMMAAVLNSQLKFEFLITELKIDINIRDSRNYSALTYAIDRDCREAFRWLLSNGSVFGEEEQKSISDLSGFKSYFNSPLCFLFITNSGNRRAFDFIMKHVGTQGGDVKKLFVDAKDEFGRNALMLAAIRNLPYQVDKLIRLSFVIGLRDREGNTALYHACTLRHDEVMKILLKRIPKIDDRSIKVIIENIPRLLAKEAVENKKEVAALVTYSPEDVDQKGRISKFDVETPRPVRSFSNERERQLLKQISTQLYFKLRDESLKELQEVEIMHMDFNGRNLLFIAVNEASVSGKVPIVLGDLKRIQTILTTKYEPKRDPEGNRRSRLYAAKIANRVYSETPRVRYDSTEDKRRAEQVVTLLRTGTFCPLELELEEGNILSAASKEVLGKIFRFSKNLVFAVVVKKHPKGLELRHAEEYLTDIAEYAAVNHHEDGAVYTCIGGKKRPCMGCAGRMQSVISQYGKRPGRYFKHTGETQSDAASGRTITLLLSSSSHVTRTPIDVLDQSYDSASDSEQEPEKISRGCRNVCC